MATELDNSFEHCSEQDLRDVAELLRAAERRGTALPEFESADMQPRLNWQLLREVATTTTPREVLARFVELRPKRAFVAVAAMMLVPVGLVLAQLWAANTLGTDDGILRTLIVVAVLLSAVVLSSLILGTALVRVIGHSARTAAGRKVAASEFSLQLDAIAWAGGLVAVLLVGGMFWLALTVLPRERSTFVAVAATEATNAPDELGLYMARKETWPRVYPALNEIEISGRGFALLRASTLGPTSRSEQFRLAWMRDPQFRSSALSELTDARPTLMAAMRTELAGEYLTSHIQESEITLVVHAAIDQLEPEAIQILKSGESLEPHSAEARLRSAGIKLRLHLMLEKSLAALDASKCVGDDAFVKGFRGALAQSAEIDQNRDALVIREPGAQITAQVDLNRLEAQLRAMCTIVVSDRSLRK